MVLKQLTCREHGGTFTVEARRGRPPVRCSPDNVCASVAANAKVRVIHKEPVVSTPAEQNLSTMTFPELRAYARSIGLSTGTKLTNRPALRNAIRKYLKPADAEVVAHFESAKLVGGPIMPAKRADTALGTKGISAMHAAWQRLEELGWKVSMLSSADQHDPTITVIPPSLTATRGEETISLAWDNTGNLLSQDYHLWSEKPSRNNKPASKLPFDPDEVSDRELVRMLAGVKITWWNVLAGAEETAVVNPQSVKVAHAYDGHGDEQPADRVLTFVATGAGGFRSVRIGALLKVG